MGVVEEEEVVKGEAGVTPAVERKVVVGRKREEGKGSEEWWG